MQKLQSSQILIKNARLTAEKLSEKNPIITKLIEDIKNKQAEVLKLKEVDQDRLRMVVQL